MTQDGSSMTPIANSPLALPALPTGLLYLPERAGIKLGWSFVSISREMLEYGMLPLDTSTAACAYLLWVRCLSAQMPACLTGTWCRNEHLMSEIEGLPSGSEIRC